MKFLRNRIHAGVVGYADRSALLPWTSKQLPPFAPLANRSRTRRVPSQAPKPGACTLVFWKRPPGAGLSHLLASWITGCDAWAVAADFQIGDEEKRWLITSCHLSSGTWNINGPHFMPVNAQRNAGWARVDVSALLDSGQLWDDLTAVVKNPEVRHKGMAPIAYLTGQTDPECVTCSGLIGNAILRQPDSPLAKALGEVLHRRFLPGEITPADLARAATCPAPETETLSWRYLDT